MSNKNTTRTLQIATSIATILALVLAFVVWLIPNPLADPSINATDANTPATNALKMVTSISLVGFGICAFAFSLREGREWITYKIEFRGDWMQTQIVMMGLMLIFSSFLLFARIGDKQSVLFVIGLTVFLVVGLTLVLAGFRQRYDGVRGKGEVTGESSRAMQIIASMVIILGLLSAILIGLVVVQGLLH